MDIRLGGIRRAELGNATPAIDLSGTPVAEVATFRSFFKSIHRFMEHADVQAVFTI